jgi:ubiquinone/menaquinone biosynthesis C-methylase UbiE
MEPAPIEKHMLSKIYHKDNKHIYLLVQLLGKFIRVMSKDQIKKIYHMIKTNEPDSVIINYISKNRPTDIAKSYDSKKRAVNMSNIWIGLFDMLKKDYPQILIHPIKKYLDIGCNTGSITVEFGKKLGLSENDIYGIDVEIFTQQKIQPVPGFIFKYYDGYNIPFDNEFFDLITCSMVLHHIEHIEIILKEMNRVLKINGLLFIKEHDAYSPYISMLIYLEHILYDVMDYGIKYEDFVKSYEQYVFDKKTLNSLLNKYGFTLIKYYDASSVTNKKRHNPTKHYFAFYKKIRNV